MSSMYSECILKQKYGQDAKRIAADTQALLDEFEKWLEVLNKNIDEVSGKTPSRVSSQLADILPLQ